MRITFGITLLFLASLAHAQVPGSIADPATPAINPMDPNGDGFITSTGAAFSGPLDQSEFELPYIPMQLYQDERGGDGQVGTGCEVYDLVDDPTQNAHAAYYYFKDPDGIRNNGDELIFFRLRMARFSNGKTGFSVLLDTDHTFGFSGPEADPNAIAGNPGFEREVVVFNSTGAASGVKTFNVDGVADGSMLIYNASIHSNHQVAYALNQDAACSSRVPTFADMYVPFSTLGISPGTQVRMAVAVNADPETSLGGGASDIGGVDGDVIIADDDQFIAAIANFSPITFENTVNVAPAVVDATISLDENSGNGIGVHTVSATDDNGDVLVYSITGGNANSAFTIDSGTGLITVNNSLALDAEVSPVFTLVVEVSDGTLTNNAVITVALNDMNESPPVAQDAILSLDENTINGLVFHNVTATDPDPGSIFTYSITGGNTGAAFTINSSSGEITVNNSTALNYETMPVFTLTVRASDGTYQDEAAITINLNDVNDAPVAPDAGVSINENTPDGAAVHTVSAMDEDAGAVLSYSILGGNTGAAFAIDGASGAITVNNFAALDYEGAPVFTLAIRVSDGVLFDDAAITINVTDVNDPPSVPNGILVISENSPNGTLVGNATATDPEGSALTYSIIAGNTSAAFAINNSTGVITVNNSVALDREFTPSFSLTIQVSDGSYAVDGMLTINLNDVSEEPPVASDAVLSVDEHPADGTLIHTVTAADPDVAAVLIYSIIGGNAGDAFAIHSASGQITVNNSVTVDYETTPIFNLSVRVSDGTYSDDAVITINLNDMNDPPAASGAAVWINENTSNATAVHTTAGTDPDAVAALSYSIIAGNGGTAFAVDGATGIISVSNSGALDFESTPVFLLTIRVSDGVLFNDAVITINLNDVNDQPPTATDAVVSLDENSANGIMAHAVAATDPDATSVITYSIIAGNTGSAFVIDNSTGEIAVNNSSVLNFETTASFILTVQVDDGIFTDDAVININLNDVNEQPPVAMDAVLSLNEYSATGALVHTVAATDPDGAAILNYAIISGNTGNAFDINSSSGAITVADEGVLDYEINPLFTLTVRVSDGTYFDDAEISISLIDTNDPPSAPDAVVAIDENTPNGTMVYNATGTDANGDILAYSIIAGNTGSAFAIDNTSGQITVNDATSLDAETTAVFLLTIRISDGSDFHEVSITVNLNDVNEQPSVAGDAVISLNENAAGGAVVGTVSATDPDITAVLTYSIIAGNTGAAFTINAATGEITVSNPAALDYESSASFLVTVQVSDGTFTDNAAITINLNDVNEVPSVTDAAITLDENSANATAVHTVTGTDPDAAAALTYSIIAGNAGAAFAINSNTGEITVNNISALNFEAGPSFVLTIRANDGSLTGDCDITINLNDVNEKPSAPDEIVYLDENSVSGFPVDTVSGTDPDAAFVLTYSMTAGNTGNAFAINSTTGIITVNDPAALDFETMPSFIINVRVGDGTLSHDAILTINLNDLSERPSGADAAVSLDEHSANGTTLHTVTVSDSDAGTVFSYSIFAGNTGSAFDINSNTGELTVNDPTAVDFESTPSFTLTVRVSDGGLFDDAFITIGLNDINEAPSPADATLSLNENTANGVTVHTVNGADPDGGAVLTYAITAGNTGMAFAIDSNTGEITANDVLDFETMPSYTLTVNVSDGSLSGDASVTINLNDANEAPSGMDATVSLDENSVNGTAVHAVSAADPDAGALLAYSITAGNTGTTFAIDNNTGQISVNDASALDFETTPSYTLNVRVTDGGLFDDVAIIVNINDINETLSAADAAVSLNEHTPAGTTVHTVAASDADGNAMLTYTLLAGNAGNAFAMNSATGEITVNDAALLDFENTPSFTLSVRVSDGIFSDDATVTISLNDVNESPSCASAIVSLNENPLNGTTVHSVEASDPDAGAVLTYSITAGNTGTAFAINNTTGEVVVNNAAAVDFEMAAAMTITVRVSDGNLFTDGNILVNLNNANEAPQVQDATITLEARFVNNDSVYTVVAIDPDAGDVLSFSIVGGNPDNIFAITPDRGQIIIQDASQLTVEPRIFDLEISATDQGGLSGAGIVSLSIQQIPDQISIAPQKGFSPDGDGVNDFWLINGIESFPDNHIQVFNRWGMSVYEAHGYDNRTNAWRGEMKGGTHGVESTYFFVIRAQGVEPISGYVIVKP
ncbi:MAG: cadherin domain-containing protein [Chryseosolibacter sp.]